MRQVYKVTALASIEAETAKDAVWGLVRAVMEGKVAPYVEIKPRTVFPKHTGGPSGIPARPGTWWPAGTAAQVMCPKGHTLFLVPEVHTIRPSPAGGEVSPSLVCKADGCSFHDWITLEGWEGEAKP
jgi:hypothetical protein